MAATASSGPSILDEITKVLAAGSFALGGIGFLVGGATAGLPMIAFGVGVLVVGTLVSEFAKRFSEGFSKGWRRHADGAAHGAGQAPARHHAKAATVERADKAAVGEQASLAHAATPRITAQPAINRLSAPSAEPRPTPPRDERAESPAAALAYQAAVGRLRGGSGRSGG